MRDDFQPAVYLLGRRRNGTIYVGVTSNLLARLFQHRAGTTNGFTERYGVKRLLWFEQHGSMHAAITREKQLKKWNRAWKINLIEESNPDWKGLALDFGLEPLPSGRVVSSGDGFPRSRE